MAQSNVPRRRSGKRAGQHDNAPAHFTGASAARPRPTRQRPQPPATPDPPRQRPPTTPRQPRRATSSSPAPCAAPAIPTTHTQPNTFALARAIPWPAPCYLAYAVLALLAAEIGVIALMYLTGRVLCALCAMRYGNYACPW